MHEARGLELRDAAYVYRAPDAAGLARREANDITVRAEALPHAVDPAETQRDVHGFRPSDTLTAGRLLVKPDPQFPLAFMMLFEPGAKRLGRFEEDGFHDWQNSRSAARGA